MAAPSLVAPSGGTVAVNEPVALAWSVQESQSAFQVRVRTDGASTWDVLDLPVTAGGDLLYLLAADVLPPGEYEWQAGVVSPTVYPSPTTYPGAALFPSYTDPPATHWSASAFFAGRLRPAAPALDAPAAGETVDKSSYTVRWTPADLPGVPQAQQRFRVRRRRLDGTVVADSGEVVSTATELLTRIDSTDVWRTFDVQVFHDGLWSPLASRDVYVFFVGPPSPELVVVVDGGSVVVTVTNPPPGAQQPAVVRNEVHRRMVGEAGDGIRLADAVPPDSAFTDWTPASRQPYAYRVVAVGSDGNPTATDWQE